MRWSFSDSRQHRKAFLSPLLPKSVCDSLRFFPFRTAINVLFGRYSYILIWDDRPIRMSMVLDR